jgi:tRNA 2-selenouridine synthase
MYLLCINMPIQKITIAQFLELANQHPIFDVRSPGEYTHAHIPNAISFPLFTDDERKQVGTAYKQQSREQAIKIGLDFFGGKMRKFVEDAEKIVGSWQLAVANKADTTNSQLPTANCLLLHCWRGGMRSAAVAWLLDLYGFKVYTLIGGYKAYRNWVLQQFENDYNFTVIGGKTGSGKTYLLQELKNQNKSIVDLEGLANHKGSAFGNMGVQPKQEMFENLLAEQLHSFQDQPSKTIFIEDESQRIGDVKIPDNLWVTMRKSNVAFIDIPFEERLKHIVTEYGTIPKDELIACINRIQKRLGGLETKNAINYLTENNTEACFKILLAYYDKWYSKGLQNRENLSTLLNKIPCPSVNAKANTNAILILT